MVIGRGEKSAAAARREADIGRQPISAVARPMRQSGL